MAGCDEWKATGRSIVVIVSGLGGGLVAMLIVDLCLMLLLGKQAIWDMMAAGPAWYSGGAAMLDVFTAASTSIQSRRARIIHSLLAVTVLVAVRAAILSASARPALPAIEILCSAMATIGVGLIGACAGSVVAIVRDNYDESRYWNYETKDGCKYRVASAPRFPIRAIIWFSLGLGVMIWGAHLVGSNVAQRGFEREALFVLGPHLWFGMFAFQRARRMIAPPVKQILEEDRRPPIVYLRGFDQDRTRGRFNKHYGNLLLQYMALPVFYGSTEDSVASAFRSMGPVIAAGRPGESLPILGASRLYVPNEYWRDVLADLISRSRARILRCGTSPGLKWECQEAFRHCDFATTLILLDFDQGWWRSTDRQHLYGEFKKWAQPLIAPVLPETIGDAIAIYFDDDGAAYLLHPHDNILQRSAILRHPLRESLGKLSAMDGLDPSNETKRTTAAGASARSFGNQLEQLSLSGTTTDDRDLVDACQMYSLRTLWLRDTRITDAALRHVGSVVTLEELYLDNTQITDAGLHSLTGLKKLKLIGLKRTGVTAVGVAALKKAIPELVVECSF